MDSISELTNQISGSTEFLQETNNELDSLDLRLKMLITKSKTIDYTKELIDINKSLNIISGRIEDAKKDDNQ